MKERQKTLFGAKVNNITTKFGTLQKGTYRKFTLFKVLKAFYDDYTEIGLSMVELKKILRNDMSPNSMINSIKTLLLNDSIALCMRNVGPTKRRKYYKLTEKGAKYFENNL